MKDTVVMKGTKSGIILVLKPEADYEELKAQVAEKFKAASNFLGQAEKALAFQGKELTDEQKMELVSIIQANCKLSIVCLIENDETQEKLFKQALEKNRVMAPPQDASTGQFFKGNLRSGQVLDVETSIIIIGDVKAGAKVVSRGNVIILGSLKGNVYAGSSGNENAFVVALDMDPMQIRIADTIARSPDKRVKSRKKETKIAFLEEGNIYIEPLDRDVISDIKL